MYVIAKSKITGGKCEAISKHVYRTNTLKGLNLPDEVLVFRKVNSKRVRIGAKRANPSFNLVIFGPDVQDKQELRRMLRRSLAVKIAPSHFIFPNVDYDSLKHKKIVRQGDFRKRWEDMKVIASLHPEGPSTRSLLEKIAMDDISTARDRIKRACLSPGARDKGKNGFSKKASDLRGRLGVLKTKCQAYSLFLNMSLEKEYMKAYLTFSRYRKSRERSQGR